MKSVVVAQLGARMHYAVPEIFHKNGLLQGLHTDLYSNKPPFKYLPLHKIPGLQKLAGRQSAAIPASHVQHYPLMGIEYVRKLRQARTVNDQLKAYIWAGKTFGEKICRNLPFDKVDGIYGFNTASLEVFRKARQYPVKLIYEQTIAPLYIERQLLEDQENRFPEWLLNKEKFDQVLVDEMVNREREEMEMADLIIGASSFVKESIRQFHPSVADKCRIVPYGTRQKLSLVDKNYNGKRKLRVLVAGTIGLRKGTQYVLQAARLLGSEVDLRLVGSMNLIPQEIKNELSKALDLKGLVPRAEMPLHYEWADVFLLPSICEGSATVTYEAMQYGLPLIVTSNTGSIIEDGKEGLIIPQADSNAIQEAVLKMKDPDSWRFFHENVKKKNAMVTIAAYEQRLLECIENL